MIQHNDVLMFGATTNFAVDISAAGGATGTPTPNITIGYKRTEAVWMPFMANAAAAETTWKPNSCPGRAATCVPSDQFKYLGHGEQKADGASQGNACSVIASFGAKASAVGSNASNAGLGLAQFSRPGSRPSASRRTRR